MKKDNKKNKDECQCNESCEAEAKEKVCQSSDEAVLSEVKTLKKQLSEKTKKCEEYLDKLQRTTAEFDNYKKRTAKERESLYSEIAGDVISSFLPIVDNFERAIAAAKKGDGEQGLKEGIELLLKQMRDVMKTFGVEEIVCVGECFDPHLHNAVMHVEDEDCGQNICVEEFQKGYSLKDKVIRHSMVKVAN